MENFLGNYVLVNVVCKCFLSLSIENTLKNWILLLPFYVFPYAWTFPRMGYGLGVCGNWGGPNMFPIHFTISNKFLRTDIETPLERKIIFLNLYFWKGFYVTFLG